MNSLCSSKFWDSNITWYTTAPDFTICFKKTVLIWIPCLILLICAPFELMFIRNSKRCGIPFNKYNITKLACICILLTISLVRMFHTCFVIQIEFVDVYSTTIQCITFLLLLILTYGNIKMGLQSSGILFSVSLVFVVCGLPEFRSKITGNNMNTENRFTYCIYYIIVVVLFILNCFPDMKPKYSEFTETDDEPLNKQSSFTSNLFFIWFDPFVWKGFKKPLHFDDLVGLVDEKQRIDSVKKFQWNLKNSNSSIKTRRKYTKLENENDKKCSKQVSIVTALCKTFWPSFSINVILLLLVDIHIFVSPILLSYIIDFITSDDMSYWHGQFYTLLIFLTNLTYVLILTKSTLMINDITVSVACCLRTMIYKKTLRLSNNSAKEFSSGEIVTLMAIDVNALMELVKVINALWTTPIEILMVMTLLYRLVGFSTFVGFSSLFVFLCIAGVVVKKLRVVQVKQMEAKGQRANLISELLSGIKVLKLNAWEPYFEEVIRKIRDAEIELQYLQCHLQNVFFVIFMYSPYLVLLGTLGTYVLVNDSNVMNEKVAFLTLYLFFILKIPLFKGPKVSAAYFLALVSIDRINRFLNAEEINLNHISHTERKERLIIENGIFSWNENEQPILKDINLKIEDGKLISIVGFVGSGKSSLLAAILGGMYKVSGFINLKGSIAYIPQQAWIINTTVRENITLGAEIDEDFYHKVLEVCALVADLEQFPGGDLTEIGEKGINVSGGQKQRINLARAICFDSDIYLLDDPLSAVDPKVGAHIFEQAIGPNGFLKNKTRIMVTHSTTFLHEFDSIIVLDDGVITAHGNYEGLLAHEDHFAEFLTKFANVSQTVTFVTDKLQKDKSMMQIPLGTDENVEEGYQYRYSLTKRKINKKRVNKVKNDEASEKLIIKEEIFQGGIKKPVYQYFIAPLSAQSLLINAGLFVAYIAFSTLSSVVLAIWTSDRSLVVNGFQDTTKRNMYLWIFAFFIISQGVLTLLSLTSLFISSLKIAKSIHNRVLNSVLRWPLVIFDITPIGRIVNRFLSDIEVIDTSVSYSARSILITSSSVFGLLITMFCVVPISSFIVIIPVSILVLLISVMHARTRQSLKRIKAVSESFVYSHFSETIIEPEEVSDYFVEEILARKPEDGRLESYADYLVDTYISEESTIISAIVQCPKLPGYFIGAIVPFRRWLECKVQCVLLIAACIIISIMCAQKDKLNTGFNSLIVSQLLQVFVLACYFINNCIDFQNNFLNVERLREYDNAEQEIRDQPNPNVSSNWPQKGEIRFEDVYIRYQPRLPLILKGISFAVHHGQKIGVVGRTGAGKSTLALSLFRILEASEGKIFIDGVDISTIGLSLLRSKLTIIPQDPVMFSQTLKFNIDPTEKYSDENIWDVLERAHLKSHVSSLPHGLNYKISEGGSNLSVGQRQLICLARALLRNSTILVLDEATASIDLETDELIQKTIRQEFTESTVITIAHRLNTVLDYDKILVLEDGRLVEYDSPYNLISCGNTAFYKMASEVGII